jgi:hypothetical protein
MDFISRVPDFVSRVPDFFSRVIVAIFPVKKVSSPV